MTPIKLTGGTAKVPVWINPDAIASIQADPEAVGADVLTLISTQDGKEHRVQESPEDVVTLGWVPLTKEGTAELCAAVNRRNARQTK